MGYVVGRDGFYLDGEPRELIGVALLDKPREFRRAGFLDLLEVEPSSLLAEAKHAFNLMLVGLIEMAAESFEFGFVAAIECCQPSGELFARRSLVNLDCGGF